MIGMAIFWVPEILYNSFGSQVWAGPCKRANIRLRTQSIASVADHDETLRRNNFDLDAATYRGPSATSSASYSVAMVSISSYEIERGKLHPDF